MTFNISWGGKEPWRNNDVANIVERKEMYGFSRKPKKPMESLHCSLKGVVFLLSFRCYMVCLYFFLSFLEASKGVINGKEKLIGYFFWDELVVIWGSIWWIGRPTTSLPLIQEGLGIDLALLTKK